MGETTRTALYDRVAALGATFKADGGWYWSRDFGDWRSEYDAVRTTAGIWDVSALVKWEFRGPDALAAADYINTNDISSSQVGQVRYGPFMNPDGTMAKGTQITDFARLHGLACTTVAAIAAFRRERAA